MMKVMNKLAARLPRRAAWIVLMFGLLAGRARADIVLSNNLLPPQGWYDSTDNVSFSAAAVVMDNLVMSAFSNQSPPPSLGNFITVNGTCSVTLDLSSGGGSFLPYTAVGSYTMRFLHDIDIGPAAHFNTEMLQLNLSGGTLPAGAMIRESPTQASTGATTVTPLGGGQYHFDSFFDIFVELSVDGGQTWAPGSGIAHSTVMPAPGALTLLGLGLLGIRRRRRA